MTDKFEDSINWNVRDDLKGLSLTDIKERQPKLDYSVALINTNGELNIGVAMRSAVIFGASEFFVVGKKKYDKRSTVGAQNYIKLSKMDQETFVSYLKEDNEVPVVFEIGGEIFDDDAIDGIHTYVKYKEKKPLFIFGSESEGVPKEILDCYSHWVYTINQVGVLRSLNVGVAASIVMSMYCNRLSKEDTKWK